MFLTLIPLHFLQNCLVISKCLVTSKSARCPAEPCDTSIYTTFQIYLRSLGSTHSYHDNTLNKYHLSLSTGLIKRVNHLRNRSRSVRWSSNGPVGTQSTSLIGSSVVTAQLIDILWRWDCHDKYGPPRTPCMDAAGAIREPDLIRDAFLYPSLRLWTWQQRV